MPLSYFLDLFSQRLGSSSLPLVSRVFQFAGNVARRAAGYTAQRRRRLHDEREILQLLLHAIKIATESLKARDGFAGVLRANAVPTAGEKAGENLGRLPRIDPRLHKLVAEIQ